MREFYAIHIGLGAFHRAHQLYYFDQLLKKNKQAADDSAVKWCYISATIRSNKKLIEQLNQQNCQYTLLQESAEQITYSQIKSLKKALFAGKGNAQELIDYIAAENTKIVSYTITEKGYYYNLSGHTFDINHMDIIHDLNHSNHCKTAIGTTVWGLYRRYQNKQSGVTLISCDNLPHNGKILQTAITCFAKEINPQFARWVVNQCTFPSSMVDRIVPAVTNESINKVNTIINYHDSVPVVTEAFSQWVIEDNFATDKPHLDQVGVQFVDNVTPFESMKLTMLNGSHSLIAYLGALAGFKTVCQAIESPLIYQLIHYYMTKVAAPLVHGLPKNISLTHYRDSLLTRFKNPHLKHSTEQIAADSSQKIPQRWLNNLTYLIEQQQDYTIYALGIAAWIVFTQGEDDQGNALTVNDPLKDKFVTNKSHFNEAQLVNSYFSLDNIFSKSLTNHITLKQKVAQYIKQIKSEGTLTTIHSTLKHLTKNDTIKEVL